MHSAAAPSRTVALIPASAGISLRSAHEEAFLSASPATPWLEVHSENYFSAGSEARTRLERIRERYPLSFHGVGLSLGSPDPLDREHLRKLGELVDRFEPGLVSEHLSWGSAGGLHLNDLLPLPFTFAALDRMSERVDEMQTFLGRRVLIENVSSYFEFSEADMPEYAFLGELVARVGCGVLLDVNNLYVNERNHGHSALEYLRAIPAESVGEIHLAGHSTQEHDGYEIVVDTHDSAVCAEVWSLYEAAVARFGRQPTMIEWDSELPELGVLIGEARRAEQIMGAVDAQSR